MAKKQFKKPLHSGALISEKVLLLSTAALGGAVVMILEILGTRIIGPVFGIGIHVWAALISVTLLALAVGYYLGGRIADHTQRLSVILACAAFFMALIPVGKTQVLALTVDWGVRTGALVSAMLLFFLPLTFLAMIGPQVIKRCTADLSKVGITSGTVLGVSTSGSILGTLLLAFYLLGTISTRIIIYGLSVILLALSLLLFFFERKKRHQISSLKSHQPLLTIVILAGSTLVLLSFGKPMLSARYQMLQESESIYGRVRVIDDRQTGIRWLINDSSTLSAKQIGEQQATNTIFPYLYFFELLVHFNPQGTKALLIGLGAGHLSSVLRNYGIAVDAIELDPHVVQAAQTHFAFQPAGDLYIGDARFEIKKLKKKYDFIVHDCFSGGTIPAHLLTLQMFQDLSRLLTEQGILALNFFGSYSGEAGLAWRSVKQTMDKVFPFSRSFVTMPGVEPIDNLIFAAKRPFTLESQAKGNAASKAVRLLLEQIERFQHPLQHGEGIIITDDFNPLEVWQASNFRQYHEMLISRLGLELIIN